MTRKIRPYVKFALRENFLYFLMLLLLVIFTIGLVLIAPGIYSSNQDKISRLETEIKDLSQKKLILDSSLGASLEGIDTDLTVMSRLIPEVEDYFSAISALEELSSKTGFVVTSYDVDLANSEKNKLSLSITGVGDEQAFINFLRQYNFDGGRLITIENVALGQEETGTFNLTLNFYNQSSSDIPAEGLDYQAALQKVEEIKSKITFNLQPLPQSDEVVVGDYEKSANPF